MLFHSDIFLTEEIGQENAVAFYVVTVGRALLVFLNKVSRDMSTEQTYWMCPSAARYDITADGAIAEPQTVFAQQSTETSGATVVPELVVVSGPLLMPAARAQAVHLAAQQDAPVLTIAVVHLPGSVVGAQTNNEALRELTGVFSSVFTVDQPACGDLVRRLIHALVTPAQPNQVIGCDFNDIRYIVAGAADECVAGYGFGRDAGPERASSAVLTALDQISRQGFSLDKARGICIAITAARATLLGREVKEVMRHIRASFAASVTVAQSIHFDDELGGAAVEVDIFAFGASVTALPSSETVPSFWTAIAVAGTGIPKRHADPIYKLARSLVLRAGRPSISLVQRNLRIAYSHAARLIDAMEGDILSPMDENGTRMLVVDPKSDPPANRGDQAP